MKDLPIITKDFFESRNNPINGNFLNFLNKLKLAGILDERRKGQIVIADD